MESHPLRMRGLKPVTFVVVDTSTDVASFTDAWIETLRNISDIFALLMSHPLRMRGLKPAPVKHAAKLICRILYGCVD